MTNRWCYFAPFGVNILCPLDGNFHCEDCDLKAPMFKKLLELSPVAGEKDDIVTDCDLYGHSWRNDPDGVNRCGVCGLEWE